MQLLHREPAVAPDGPLVHQPRGSVHGDAHRAACHYAETLEGVTVESLRARVTESELVASDGALALEVDAEAVAEEADG